MVTVKSAAQVIKTGIYVTVGRSDEGKRSKWSCFDKESNLGLVSPRTEILHALFSTVDTIGIKTLKIQTLSEKRAILAKMTISVLFTAKLTTVIGLAASISSAIGVSAIAMTIYILIQKIAENYNWGMFGIAQNHPHIQF